MSRPVDGSWSLVRPAARMAGVLFPDLSDPERQVCAAFPRGEWADLREPAGAGGRASAEVRAEVLRALLLGAGETEAGFMPAVRLRGARITGRLDLMGATLRWPLVCEDCEFDTEIRLVESVTRTVRITGSQLPGFNGTRMRLDGILNLSASVIAGAVRLSQATITGQLCLRATRAGAAPGERAEAVAAGGLTVVGGAELAELTAHGAVSLRGARVSGTLDLRNARICRPGEEAFAADNAEFGGRLDCRGMTVRGRTSLHNTRIAATLLLTGATLANPGGQALSAGGVAVGGGAFLAGGFTAAGELRLIGARLEANLTLAGATVRNPGGIAVNLERAVIPVCHAEGLTCVGRLSLTGARVGSELSLADAQLDAGDGTAALAADGAVVEGRTVLARLRARGELSLRNLQAGRGLLLSGAVLERAGGIACRLSGAVITGDLVCDRLTVDGGLRLTGAQVTGRLQLEQVTLRHPQGEALSANAVQAGQLTLRPAAPVQGGVNLSHARVGVLTDDPACWPGELITDGLTYQALEPRLPARQRLGWLTRDPAGHQPQPYEQLAVYYTGIGEPAQARAVLLARERLQRRSMTLLPRAWGVLQDVTLGYGYQPWRAVVWLALLLGAGTIGYGLHPPAPLVPGQAPHFQAFVYTLDLLLPVVDLGQKHAYDPAGFGQWFSYLLVAAGWILVTTVAAAAARVLTRR